MRSYQVPSLSAILRSAVYCLAYTGKVSGQRFPHTPYSFEYPGLSAACSQAMNSTIDCSVSLRVAAERQPLMQRFQLDEICTTSCKDSLLTIKDIIRNNCTSETDVIMKREVAYPATYVIDRFLLAYDKACMIDSGTGQYCDTLLSSWAGNGSWKPEYDCHECVFDLMAKDLETSLRWRPDLAEEFNATAWRCQLPISPKLLEPPPPYALNKSTAGTELEQKTYSSERQCASPYTLREGDTCKSIAVAQNVSSTGVMIENRLDAYCSDIAALGKTVCLPEPCKIHVVQQNDTCWDVMFKHGGMSIKDLQAWNPRLNAACSNMQDITGDVICVSAPGEPIPVKAEFFREKEVVVSDDFGERPDKIGSYPEVPEDELEHVRYNVWNQGFQTTRTDGINWLKPTAAASFSLQSFDVGSDQAQATASIAVWPEA